MLKSENNLKKKKVKGEIAFALISLFHVQIQEMECTQPPPLPAWGDGVVLLGGHIIFLKKLNLHNASRKSIFGRSHNFEKKLKLHNTSMKSIFGMTNFLYFKDI